MAAYAARAGREAYVFMPDDTPAINQYECAIAGAKTYLVNGLITDCGRIVRKGKEAMDWFDISTLKEPYRIEGKKTMGLELAEQFDWELPDVILYPTGGGTGLIGMWKAFDELAQMGWLNSEKRPRMVAVQAEGCQLFERGARALDIASRALRDRQIEQPVSEVVFGGVQVRKGLSCAGEVAAGERSFGAHECDFRMFVLLAEEAPVEADRVKRRRHCRPVTIPVLRSGAVECQPHPIQIGELATLEPGERGIGERVQSLSESQAAGREMEARGIRPQMTAFLGDHDCHERTGLIRLKVGVEHVPVSEFIDTSRPWSRQQAGEEQFAEQGLHWSGFGRMLLVHHAEKFRLVIPLGVPDRQFDEGGFESLVEIHRGRPAVGSTLRTPPCEHRCQLMLALLDVPEKDPLHAATEQRIDLPFRIEMMGHFLAVELQGHGIEREKFADVHRQEHSNLRTGGEQQILLEDDEVALQLKQPLLDGLKVFGRRLGAGDAGHDGETDRQQQ